MNFLEEISLIFSKTGLDKNSLIQSYLNELYKSLKIISSLYVLLGLKIVSQRRKDNY